MTSHLRKRPFLCTVLLLALLISAPLTAPAQEKTLVLLVQPTQREDATRRAFQPLADYLAAATGVPFSIATAPNFFAYWETVRRNAGYDLALDDAHFTDYRAQKFGFHVVAKVPGTTSYSLAIPGAARLRNPLDLAGKKVASFGPPSIGATRLSAMFPNPARRPAIIEVASSADGLMLLEEGKVAAVMLPAPALADHINRNQIKVITTAEPTPNMAVSISPRISARLRDKIRTALLGLGARSEGKEILQDTGIERFEAASAAQYDGQSRILRDFWGY